MARLVRSWRACLVAAGLAAGSVSCAPKTVIVLTIDSSLVIASGRSVDQFEVTLTTSTGTYDPFRVPTLAGGALGDSETVNLVVADSLADELVTVNVNAYNDDLFIALGSTTVTPLLGQQVNATVVLSACEADPALGGPFCDDVTDELVTCSPQGETVRSFCPFGCNAGQLRCNDCQPSTTECDGEILVTCDADGVLVSANSCAPGACFMGACVACEPGTVDCRLDPVDMSGSIVTCDMDGNVVDTLDCPYGCDAKAVACFDCFAGMTQCIDANTLVDCDANGMIVPPPTVCTYGCNVATNACNACTPDATGAMPECQADDLVTCDAGGNVVTSTPCAAFGCNTSIDPDACNACDPDPGITAQCIDADTLVTCSTGGQVVTTTECAPSVCDMVLGQCGTCTPSTTFCAGSGSIYDCDASGMATLDMACPYGCNTAAGTPACNLCTPSTIECQGTDLVDCNADGSAVDSVTDCSAYGCQTGTTPDQCNACTPSSVECQGSNAVTCNSIGIIIGTTPCAYGCNPADGSCYACTPGTSECQGSSFVICSAAGTVVTSTACGTLTNQCNTGTCMPGGCVAVPIADGTVCDDGQFCSTGDTCTAGSCGGAARDCNDGNACTADTCDESVNLCINNAGVLNGATCDDGAYCTMGETCSSGLCGGAMPRVCTDGNVCTVDSCDESIDACVFDAPAANGNSCSDGLFCTNPDTCTGGACGGPARSCNDSNMCTADSCDETGNVCVNAPLTGMSCSDGLFCTVADACDATGLCTGAPMNCADTNPCTADSCNDVMDACVHDTAPLAGMACDDGLFCTLGTTCTAGTCSGGSPNCNDANGCTTDTCNEVADTCSNAPVANGTSCSDGAFCTINDNCQSGFCVSGGPRDCSDTLLCNTDSCNEAADTCDHPCIPATSFCSTAANLVTCAGSGPMCGETNTACTFGCNLTRNMCNACDPSDPNVCTGTTAIVCDTVPPGEGTITSMSSCSYGCESGSPSNICFFPDTCASPYVVPVPAPPATYGPTTFTGNLSDYGADVAGSCGEAGDDVIHRIDVPMNGPFTAFSTIVLNTSGSAIETASHLTTVCGSAANELQHASVVCGASTSSGPTCYDPAGTETLRACGMPTGSYFATLDSPVTTGAFTLALTVDNVNLDTCAESGNVSNTPSSPTAYTVSTTGMADNYSFNLAPGDSPCTPASARNECGRPNGAPGGSATWTCYPGGLLTTNDVVFYYRAAATGFLTVDTNGSSFDTLLYIKNACITSCAVPSNCLKCNDDNNFTLGQSWSQIYRMPVTAGTLYYIFGDGFDVGDNGTLVLNVTFSST